jgi:hypothetical protein
MPSVYTPLPATSRTCSYCWSFVRPCSGSPGSGKRTSVSSGGACLPIWLTFFTEVAGVATGAVFGEYHYGPTMWAQWLNVPLVIALNWTLLIMATSQLAARLSSKPILAALLTGGFIVGYDYFIEPVAISPRLLAVGRRGYSYPELPGLGCHCHDL